MVGFKWDQCRYVLTNIPTIERAKVPIGRMIYDGEWLRNPNSSNLERHGLGALMFANGDKYVGAWQNDKREGQGTLTWADGAKYVGAWQNDKREGQGTLTFANGNKYVGAFKRGRAVRD